MINLFVLEGRKKIQLHIGLETDALQFCVIQLDLCNIYTLSSIYNIVF